MSTKNFFKIKRLIVKLTFAVLPDKKKQVFVKDQYYIIIWSKNFFFNNSYYLFKNMIILIDPRFN